MIIVVTTKEKRKGDGQMIDITSHGVNTDTDEIIILPNVCPEEVGAKFDLNIREYVIN